MKQYLQSIEQEERCGYLVTQQTKQYGISSWIWLYIFWMFVNVMN